MSCRGTGANRSAAGLAILAGLFVAHAQMANEGPKILFEQGQQALARGDLTAAEAAFRGVLLINANNAAAHGNLGVIAMKRKQWNTALNELHSAEKLAPKNVGIRLNIGLIYFRQNNFRSAIPVFESVIREDSGSSQSRYLLGLCYYFDEQYGNAVAVLKPVWPQEPQSWNIYMLLR